jgi:hypothetical protein
MQRGPDRPAFAFVAPVIGDAVGRANLVLRFQCPIRISEALTAKWSFFGAIAQLGERLHGMQEVRGSTPLGSTKFLN